MNTAIFKDVWSSVLESLAQQYSEATMRIWFNNLELAYVSDDTAFLIADNEFKKEIVESKAAEKNVQLNVIILPHGETH